MEILSLLCVGKNRKKKDYEEMSLGSSNVCLGYSSLKPHGWILV